MQDSPFAAQDGLAALERINLVTDACRHAGILVIHTSHVLRPDGSNIAILGEIAPIVKQGTINKGSDLAALHKGLVVDRGDILLEKPRFGAFHGTDLELILRSRGIDTIIITGIATNVCCETTAREAAVRDFRVFFLSDATATFDMAGIPAGQIQSATCATLRLLFGQVLTVDEMIKKIAFAVAFRRAASATPRSRWHLGSLGILKESALKDRPPCWRVIVAISTVAPIDSAVQHKKSDAELATELNLVFTSHDEVWDSPETIVSLDSDEHDSGSPFIEELIDVVLRGNQDLPKGAGYKP